MLAMGATFVENQYIQPEIAPKIAQAINRARYVRGLRAATRNSRSAIGRFIAGRLLLDWKRARTSRCVSEFPAVRHRRSRWRSAELRPDNLAGRTPSRAERSAAPFRLFAFERGRDPNLR